VKMKRRSRSRQPAKSGSAGEDEGRQQQQQRSGGSASSGDEISATAWSRLWKKKDDAAEILEMSKSQVELRRAPPPKSGAAGEALWRVLQSSASQQQ
jgi:hypothetical protein